MKKIKTRTWLSLIMIISVAGLGLWNNKVFSAAQFVFCGVIISAQINNLFDIKAK